MKDERTKPNAASGLARLYELHQQSVADGKKIFELVFEGKADAKTLAGIVYQESLLRLILIGIDQGKKITSRVNQGKSAKQRTVAASMDKAKVFDWCDANPKIALLPLKRSVELAMAATKVSAPSSVSDYIRAWRNAQPEK